MKNIRLGLVCAVLVCSSGWGFEVNCYNHQRSLSIDPDPSGPFYEIQIASRDKSPLIPALDPRITRIDLNLGQCAPVTKDAFFCYEDRSKMIGFFDAMGRHMTDSDLGDRFPAGNITFTFSPKTIRLKGGLSKTVSEYRLQIEGYPEIYVIKGRFEAWPGKFCNFH